MELMHNATFRVLKAANPSVDLKPGIYRVILDEPRLGKTVAALIQRETDAPRRPGGRKKKPKTIRQEAEGTLAAHRRAALDRPIRSTAALRRSTAAHPHDRARGQSPDARACSPQRT